MQAGGVIRHVSCNFGYTKITPEVQIRTLCEPYGYAQVTHEIALRSALASTESSSTSIVWMTFFSYVTLRDTTTP